MSMGAWIKAKMSLDSSGVKAGVESAKKDVGGFKSSLSNLAGPLTKAFGAAAIGAAVVKFTKDAVEMAIRTKELADQTGLTVEQFQAFGAEAIQVTGGLKAAETGLVTFRNAQQEALNGNETTIGAFKRLGISLEDIASKSTPQLLEAVAKGYKEIGDFGVLVDLFGRKNAGKLEEALIALADNGFGGLERKAKNAGMVLGDEFSDRLDQVGDAMDRFKLKAEVMWDKFLIGSYKAIRTTANFFSGMKEYAVSIRDDLLSTILPGGQSYNPLEMIQRAESSAQGVFKKKQDDDKNDDKLFRQKRAEDRKKNEEKEAALRKSKIGEIYAKEAEEAKKLEDKKADEAAKGAAKAAAAAAKEAEKAVSPDGSTVIKEIGGTAAEATHRRFDSLREIGANILGSGRIGGSPVDRNAEIARATRMTAENTARIADKLNSPAVTRLADSSAIY